MSNWEKHEGYKITEEMLLKIAEAADEIDRARHIASLASDEEVALKSTATQRFYSYHNDVACELGNAANDLRKAVVYAIIAQKTIKLAREGKSRSSK